MIINKNDECFYIGRNENDLKRLEWYRVLASKPEWDYCIVASVRASKNNRVPVRKCSKNDLVRDANNFSTHGVT